MRATIVTVGIVFTAAFVTSVVVSTAQSPGSKAFGSIDHPDHDGDFDESKVKEGFELAPVHLDLAGKNRASVGFGSYIVNAQAGCNDCHTCRSYASDPFHGGTGAPNATNYLAGGVQFDTPDGTFVSPNLTPSLTNGLPDGGHTFAQFKSMLRTGHDADPPFDTLQVMPWPVYGKMVDRDLRAVYDYLSAIPHAEPGKLFPGGPACPAPGL